MGLKELPYMDAITEWPLWPKRGHECSPLTMQLRIRAQQASKQASKQPYDRVKFHFAHTVFARAPRGMKFVRDGCHCHAGSNEPGEQPLLDASLFPPTFKKE